VIHYENMIKDKIKKKLQDILGLREPSSDHSKKELEEMSLHTSDH